MFVDSHEVDALVLAQDPAKPREGVRALPDLRAEVEVLEAGLLGELAAERLLQARTASRSTGASQARSAANQ